MTTTQPPNERPPEGSDEKSKTSANQNMGLLVSDKDLTIKFLEFKNEIDRKFSDFRAEIERRFNEFERRMDVMNIKLNLLIAGFTLMISVMIGGGGYIIKLLLELHK